MKTALAQHIQHWSQALGFQAIGFSDIDLSTAENRLQQWLSNHFHGDMDWMEHHGIKRSRPDALIPDTLSIISARMDYLPPATAAEDVVLNHPQLGYVSRYALGRDYHKVLRKQLQQLARQIEHYLQQQALEYTRQYRVFVDSAPVLEKPIAVKAGLGWMGKHSNVLSRDAGSWFFLGEIYTNIPLEQFISKTVQVDEHCGSCTACIDVCPTQAIIAPYVLDARRCISYLTIEAKGSIPVEFRQAIGNRIYGCDDCQLICPWNRFAQTTEMADFASRHHLDCSDLLTLFNWSEAAFLKKMEGSAIRRIGYERWQRNIAIALGNGLPKQAVLQSLQQRLPKASEMVAEHIVWAIETLQGKSV